MKTMAERLEALRAHKGVTQEKVEDGAELAKGTYTRLKKGGGAGPDVIGRIAAFFGVTPVWLEHGLGDAPPWLPGVEHATPASSSSVPDQWGPGRWKLVAQRYEDFRIEAGLAMGASWYSEAILDAASDDIGHQKNSTGPSRAEAREAIFRARDGIKAYEEGRLADDADLGLDAARAVAPKPKKKR